MPKTDLDTSHVPEKLTAPWFKRFFKERFGIPVRVRSGGYTDVWIPCRRDTRDLVYDHKFPAELGNLCMRAVYPKCETLITQNWGGNVQFNSIAMHDSQWREVLQKVIEGALGTTVS